MAGITVSSVEQKLDDMLQEHEELLERTADLETKINAFKLVIAECRVDADKPPLDLSGMSLEEALVTLAMHNGDELSTYRARPALVDAGLLHGDARAVSVKLYGALSRSSRFEPTGSRGQYRLLPLRLPIDLGTRDLTASG